MPGKETWRAGSGLCWVPSRKDSELEQKARGKAARVKQKVYPGGVSPRPGVSQVGAVSN